jgi:staphylococcal nuclease domain-containing protein 1
MHENSFKIIRTKLLKVFKTNIAVIEQVREGSSFRVLLFLSEMEHQFINLNLSGIITPKTEEPAEPFAQECKYFVESRLLQRTVKILIESVNGVNFYGTVLHPAGNISELLLKEGYAKIVDWNINLVKNPDVYKKIQMEAQAKKLRIWKSFIKTDKSQDYLAIVRKIIGPDLIVVESVAQPGIEQKLQLSSVRGPKKQKNEQNHEVGYFTDAIEFLRFRLIGSKVQIKIDYIKPGEGEYEARENATVFKNNKNIAEALVLKGYASVIRHRRDDNNRSSCYDSLLLAEESAKVLEVGIYSTKDLPIHRVVDASVNQAKAKGHLGQLQRSGMIKGVVEYVPSGSRFKVLFPSLSMRISLVLGGIRTPKSGGSAHKGEPFGEEASKYANDMIFQRDVEVSIENCDKTGGFIGSIFVPVSGKMENFAVLLLKQGLSTIHEFSAQQSPYKNQLFEAETEAKNAKRNIWSTYDPEAELLAEKLTNAEVVESKIVEIVVCEIKKNSLYVQVMGPGTLKTNKL